MKYEESGRLPMLLEGVVLIVDERFLVGAWFYSGKKCQSHSLNEGMICHIYWQDAVSGQSLLECP